MADKDNIVQGGASVTIGTDLGYIKDGVSVTPTAENYYHKAEGVPGDIGARRIKSGMDISFSLLELTLANIKIAWDEVNATAGGGASPETLDIGLDTLTLQERAIVVYGYVPGSDMFTRTLTFVKCVCSAPAEMKTADSEETVLACQFHALYDATGSKFATFSDAIA